MSRRHLAASLGALAAALALHAAPARAQVTRGWSVCFTTRVASCSDVLLTTTATLDVTSARTGTLVDLLVRHWQGGGVVSGLQDVAFYVDPIVPGDDPFGATVTPQPVAGAPAVPAGAEGHWLAGGAGSFPLGFAMNAFLFANNAWQDQFIGGCLGGAYDALHQSPLTTCGAQAYRFTFASVVQFDADAVDGIAIDVYAGDGNGDAFPDQAYCRAPVDGGVSGGYDFGDFAGGDVCRVRPLASAVPEPAPLALLAAALAPLAVAARRARRGRS